MVKNITIRFAIVFTTFILAGFLLIFTLQKAITLNEKIEAFHHQVSLPLERLATIARQIHAETLASLLPATPSNHRMAQSVPTMQKEVADKLHAIASFNDHTLHIPLISNELATLRQEWKRFDKARVAWIKKARYAKVSIKDRSEALRKAWMNYMTHYTTLLDSIADLRDDYTHIYGERIEEDKKNLKDTFYVGAAVALATLILLTFLLFEVNTINKKLQKFLEEKEDYQLKLAKVNEELAHYSETLEKEVKKRTDEALEHLLKNPLTKLPNRVSFMEKLNQTNRASVAIFNIDRFQSYNDLFGSEMGDKIIVDYTAYLRQTIPYLYEIYHLQGDEFAIIETQKKSAQTFLAMVKQAAKLAREFHFASGDGDFLLQISIGVAIDQKQPLIKADMALKHAKNSNERFVVYSDTIIQPHHYLENITMTKELTAAIKEERIIPYLQPIADSRTLRVHKYEVLARLEDSRGNIVPPGQFIPLAKKIRLYPDLTRVIFKKAMDIVEQHGLHLSVNISAEDIHHTPTRDYIIDRLALSQRSDHLTIELLESEEAQNYEDIRRFIEKIKHYGVAVAIDDFGTGYSNFAKLLKLKVDYLKIDGSFIQKIDTDEDSKEFVEIIHRLAANYGIKTVAEFVCSPQVHEEVKNLGIDYVQGYHIAEPMPLEALLSKASPTPIREEEEQAILF